MRKTGIRRILIIYVVVVALLCGLVIYLSNFITHAALDDSGVLVQCLNSLSGFYNNIESMDQSARAYVYDRKAESYAQFESFRGAAEANLDYIESVSDGELLWRMERLRSMINYYQMPLDWLDADQWTADVYAAYNLLNYRGRLITRTATPYYRYLSDFMARSKQMLQRRWQRQRTLQYMILVCIVAIALAVGFIYTRMIYGPIKTLVANTERIKRGEYRLAPVSTRLRELSILDDAFNNMSESIEGSIGMLKENARLEVELLKQENDNLEMRNLVTEAELHSLQAQINPHFVFNTLSMISKSAYVSGDTVASELMDKLSEFLRYATGKANKNSTLYEELESIKNYIFIQQRRFGERIQFEIDVEDAVPNIAMPAVVLQPLIENAVLHGVGDLTEQAQITVQVGVYEGHVRIQIEDNGSGMDAESLETLLGKLKLGFDSSAGGSGHGIGLSNVYRRLKMFFGNEMQFTIESEQGCGTVIVLTLPTEDGANE